MIILFLRLFFLFVGIISSVKAVAPEAHLHLSAVKMAKMPLLIVLVSPDQALEETVPFLIKDFSFSQQWDVFVERFATNPTKKDIASYAQKGFMLVVFLTSDKEHNAIEWRVYDTLQATLKDGKRYIKKGKHPRIWAHALADRMWPLFTGQDPFFSSKLAYCKVVKNKKGKRLQHIYIADYDGSYSEPLITLPTISVVPVWNQDPAYPRLWYSEYAATNVKLMSVDMHKKRTVVSSQDGITMLPAFCKKSGKVVYCASGGTGHCQLFCYHKGIVEPLTHTEKNSMSPVFGYDENSLYFCSDQTGLPQIYSMSLLSKKSDLVTQGGFCTAPAYCVKKRLLAYVRKTKGVMQLWVYDEISKKHTQLTHDKGDKAECSWSPCGNYLIYGVSWAGKNRIAMLHLSTNKQIFITPEDQHCSYPSWSPLYAVLPVVQD